MWLLAGLVFASWLGESHSMLKVFRQNVNGTVMIIDEKQPVTYNMPPDDGAVGRLVMAEPITACTGVPPVPYPSNDTFSWFLLAKRYSCPFAVKLRNAQRAGYSGLIIYDAEEPSFLHGSSRGGGAGAGGAVGARAIGLSDIGIYGVLVSKADGAFLQRCTYDRGFLIQWFPGLDFNLLGYLIPCIIIMLFCILMIACLVFTQHCSRWYRERRRNAKYRLAKKYLKQLPVKKWTKGSPEFEKYESCSICLDEYQEGDKLRILPCQHAYHASRCIDPWLTKNRRVCPLCKRKIVLPGMPEDSSDDETAPLLGSQQTNSGGGTFEEQDIPQRPRQIEIQAEMNPQPSTSAPVYAPGGHYSVNDQVEALPRERPRTRRKKRTHRRHREVLDDVAVTEASTSTLHVVHAGASGGDATETVSPVANLDLQSENQLVCVIGVPSDDDERPLV